MRSREYLFGSYKFLTVFFLLFSAATAFYLYEQQINYSVIADILFVLMLIIGTIILIVGSRIMRGYLIAHGEKLYQDIYGDNYKVNFDSDMTSLFGTYSVHLSGTAFAVLFMAAIYFLKIWSNAPIVQFSFIIFLGFVNFITGCGIYTLIRFILLLVLWIKNIRINPWEKKQQSITSIRGIKNRATLVASVYISITLSGVAFSTIQIGNAVYAYSAFAMLLLCIAFIAPEILIFQQISAKKDEVNGYIENLISIEYEKIKNDSNKIENEINTKNIMILIRFNSAVDDFFKSRAETTTIISFLSVVFVSILPVIVQILLEKFM